MELTIDSCLKLLFPFASRLVDMQHQPSRPSLLSSIFRDLRDKAYHTYVSPSSPSVACSTHTVTENDRFTVEIGSARCPFVSFFGSFNV
jgi:hypothetical protein